MRHFVNFSLLFFFVTLVASGLLRFFQPFELVTTRVHIVFGFGVLALVALHLAGRGDYFRRMLTRRKRAEGNGKPPPWKMLTAVVLTWAFFLAASLWDLPPVPQLVGRSYESQNRAVIFRPDGAGAVRTVENGFELRRVIEGEAMITVEVVWGPSFDPEGRFADPFNKARPQVAIWAESDTGAMIETFFVSEESAFSEGIKWAGNELGRVDILPLWRHSYTLVNGVDPKGKIDAYSTATPEHAFSVSDYLTPKSDSFTINVEVNVPGDTNDFYHQDQPEDAAGYVLEGIGQPSVRFSGLIDPSAGKKYHLLDLVGHGGSSSEMDGNTYYDLENLTTARDIVERILVRVEFAKSG